MSHSSSAPVALGGRWEAAGRLLGGGRWEACTV